MFERRCRCVCPHELEGITDNQTVFQREVTDPNDWYAICYHYHIWESLPKILKNCYVTLLDMCSVSKDIYLVDYSIQNFDL